MIIVDPPKSCRDLGVGLIVVGVAGSVGTALSLVTDFGLPNLVERIRLNQDIFMNQYLSPILVMHGCFVAGAVFGAVGASRCTCPETGPRRKATVSNAAIA